MSFHFFSCLISRLLFNYFLCLFISPFHLFCLVMKMIYVGELVNLYSKYLSYIRLIWMMGHVGIGIIPYAIIM